MAIKKKAKKKASIKYKRVYKKARKATKEFKRTASTGARYIKEAIK